MQVLAEKSPQIATIPLCKNGQNTTTTRNSGKICLFSFSGAYGARYLDPRTSRWISADPAVSDYIPQMPIDDDARKRNQNLPGQGGVYNLVNLHVYHYAGNNPVKYTDPDGAFFLLDDLLLSLIGNLAGLRDDGILNGTWHNFKNSWAMLGHSLAMWYQTLWFLPQELLGLLCGWFAIGLWGGTVEYDEGFKYINMPTVGGAVTLGSIGMGNPDLKDHEKGHYYQSWILGWSYLYFIGVPSLIHAGLHNNHCEENNYYHFSTEKHANELAKKYANKKNKKISL